MYATHCWNWARLLGDRADECQRQDGFNHLRVLSVWICLGRPAQSLWRGGGSPTSVCLVRPHATVRRFLHQEGSGGLPAVAGGAVLGPHCSPN